MWDPLLPDDHFLRDEEVVREPVFDSADLIHVEGAFRDGETVRFRGSLPLRVSLPRPERDLSRFNRLRLTVLNSSEAPLLVGMRLRHGSRDERPALPSVSTSGGRETLLPGDYHEKFFPMESFGRYGFGEGWDDIEEIELLLSREKTAGKPEEADIAIRCLEGEFRRIPAGPRLTSAGLRGAFSRNPEDRLARTAATGQQATPSERQELYSPANSAFSISAPHPYPVGSGADVLRGRIMGQVVSHPIQWNTNPSGVLEWHHFLHRHHFIRDLVRSLAETGDERYAVRVDEVIRSWIRSCPVPLGSNGGAGPSWETLSAAWRLREWLWVAGTAWSHPAFRSSTKELMLCSIWEHARSLMDHRGHPNNWIIVESAALALAGICFPEFRDARTWVEEGVERLRIQFGDQFFEDGAHFEMSPLYHAICLHALLEVKQAATFAEVDLPAEFDGPLARCADYLAAICRPDFTWPSLNDSGSVDGDFTGVLRLAGEIFGRADLTWIGTRGAHGCAPDAKSVSFPHAGVSVMRSDYVPDANFLVFRTGPAGAAHAHEDVLSLDLAALGVPRLCDPGITTYAADPLTDYYRSAQAHNTVLIDGKGPQRVSLPFTERVRAQDLVFAVSARGEIQAATGMSTGPWTDENAELAVVRSAVFVSGSYWVVRDLVIGSGEHEVTACWQFSPGRIEMDIETLGVRCVDARGPGFVLIPLVGPRPIEIEQFTGASDPPRGWISLNGTDIPAPHLRYHVSCPLPVSLFWALLPVSRAAWAGFKASRRDREDDGTTLEMRFPDGKVDLLSFDSVSGESLGSKKDAMRCGLSLERLDKNGSRLLSDTLE
jgi:hypothetical protein